jgi:Flp pilus assembly protein TadG
MRLTHRLRHFGTARQGLAALEFAILLPMMVFLLFGAVELIDLLQTNRRVENTASSIADVVSRDNEVTDSEVTGMWRALELLMIPDNAADLNIRITSVSIPDSSTATVIWSEGRGMSARVANSSVTLPANMMRAGTSIIMAETEYSYDSPIGIFMDAPMSLQHVVYRRSRLVDPITRLN